jgi:hypothetical protein
VVAVVAVVVMEVRAAVMAVAEEAQVVLTISTVLVEQ